jgi:hypothetical protein
MLDCREAPRKPVVFYFKDIRELLQQTGLEWLVMNPTDQVMPKFWKDFWKDFWKSQVVKTRPRTPKDKAKRDPLAHCLRQLVKSQRGRRGRGFLSLSSSYRKEMKRERKENHPKFLRRPLHVNH